MKTKMNIFKEFKNYIKEEVKVEDVDDKTLETMKLNFLDRIKEYRNYIVKNIEYDTKKNKIYYKNFENIDIKTILRELNNEFTEEFVEDLNVKPFLRKINQIMDFKKRNTKKIVKKEFENYIKSLDDRINTIRTSTSKIKDEHFDDIEKEKSVISKKRYKYEKYEIQIELLKLQEWVKKNNEKVVIIFEGRDAAGKGSTIKRFIEYLNPDGFKVVALGKPTKEESENWFERYEKHMPKPGEIVFFDRSWYNRAVIEPTMGYCTEEQYREFMDKVLNWERNLIINENITLIKFWFSISKEKQEQRFEIRKKSPLKYWKFSPNDAKVLSKWDIITKFKKQMFEKTSNNISPWVIINSNDKKTGRLNAMRYVLSVVDYNNKDEKVSKWYPEIVNVVK